MRVDVARDQSVSGVLKENQAQSTVLDLFIDRHELEKAIGGELVRCGNWKTCAGHQPADPVDVYVGEPTHAGG